MDWFMTFVLGFFCGVIATLGLHLPESLEFVGKIICYAGFATFLIIFSMLVYIRFF